MNKLLFITFIGIFMLGCAAQEAAKEFHPTDDVNEQSQGGKGFTAEDKSENVPLFLAEMEGISNTS